MSHKLINERFPGQTPDYWETMRFYNICCIHFCKSQKLIRFMYEVGHKEAVTIKTEEDFRFAELLYNGYI